MISSALSVGLTCLIVLCAAWVIIWLLKWGGAALPAIVEKVIWIVAVIICCIKVAYWAGL